ncbi:MAG: nuclear transport factor 2 family protein [Acidobacteriota bacterium]
MKNPSSALRSLTSVLPVLTLALAACATPAGQGDPAEESAAGPAGEDSSMPSAQEFSHEADLRALNATVADFAAFLMTEDLDGFMDLFAEDAIRLPPEATAEVGIDAIRASQYRQFEDFDQDITIRMDESEFSGDLAFVRGTFAVTQTRTQGPTIEMVGSWMNLMRRSPDGKWRIARNMWNRDRPLPPTS